MLTGIEAQACSEYYSEIDENNYTLTKNYHSGTWANFDTILNPDVMKKDVSLGIPKSDLLGFIVALIHVAAQHFGSMKWP